jgi:transcriptional regulator with XRE-family HTH domain
VETLEELIARVMDTEKLTQRELARRDPTGKLTDQRISQMRRGSKEFPEPATVVALAKALRLPEQDVLLSIAKSLGLAVRHSPPLSVPDAIARDDSLLPEAKQHLTVQHALLLRIQTEAASEAGDQKGAERGKVSDQGGKVSAIDKAAEARRRIEERKRGGRS